jgi:hypothetical protein
MLLCISQGKERRKEEQRRRQKSLYGFVVTSQYYKKLGWWDLFCSHSLLLPFFCCKKPHSIQPFVLFRVQLVALFFCDEFFFSTWRQNPPQKKRPLPFLWRNFYGKKYKIKKGPKSPGFWGGKKKKKVKIADLDNRFKHVVKNLNNRTFLCDL